MDDSIPQRRVEDMTDEELEDESANLPWPLDGIITNNDEPTIERANEIMHEQDRGKP